ncbi:DUF2974 domain-containing protein [Miniphocaeibacter massiliensis]|uniref:DUF2974 domain-containing protein n=1 Tax=Miniphocaeibacter massiliensis TaxID=2041841 RepID=UPI000C1BECDA|nr:DUF2974 domain-containing protein [Miniphocaeibacter massiliensis]
MSNLFDYLFWRGDLTFKQSEFNNVDALILSRLSYLNFDGIISPSFSESVPLKKASDIFFSQDDKLIEEKVIMEEDMKLLEKLSSSNRFKDMEIFGYVNEIDEVTEKQFSVITINIDNKRYFVSFRGTDNTLIGWKEDFNMTFMDVVPAQVSAKKYLNSLSNYCNVPLIVGGHSKGGNLAIYSSAFCKPQLKNNIEKIYNFDGPGFNRSILNKEEYLNITSKINNYIPQSSIVGLLLQNEGDNNIIHSTQEGIMQHDLYSWDVNHNDFIYLEKTTKDSLFVKKTLKDWLANTDQIQREEFFDTIHNVLSDTNADSINSLNENWYKTAIKILSSYKNLDDSAKEMISEGLGELMNSAKKNFNIYMPNFLNFSNNKK